MADALTRDAFELAYATEWKKSRRGSETIAELAAEVRGWRAGDTYGDDLPRLRFGWEAYQWALAAQAPAQPAEAVAWEYRNQHGNPFLSHTDPHKWHPHDQEGFGQFRALVYAAPSHPDRAVMQQALDALQTLLSMQAEWHAAFPEHVGDKEAPAMQAARSAIAALSATMEKP